MKKLIVENVRLRSGFIDLEGEERKISDTIQTGTVVILKHVFETAWCEKVRHQVFQWGQSIPDSNPANPAGSFHRIDHNPVKSKTKHIFHSYAFIVNEREEIVFNPGEPSFDPKDLMFGVQAMRSLQNRLAGADWGFAPDSEGRKLRPQVIQYPTGGGFFDQHDHPLKPQMQGLICSLSQRGKDFHTGGTRFWVNGECVEIENDLEIGDIAIFKYDLPHDVSVVDAGPEPKFGDEAGRWSLVLPFN